MLIWQYLLLFIAQKLASPMTLMYHQPVVTMRASTIWFKNKLLKITLMTFWQKTKIKAKSGGQEEDFQMSEKGRPAYGEPAGDSW